MGAATTGLLVLVAGLALGAFTAQAHQTWLLIPCAIVLGCAYGLCLVAGLVEIQRLADHSALAGLTAAYYALTYLGFAAPICSRWLHIWPATRSCSQSPPPSHSGPRSW